MAAFAFAVLGVVAGGAAASLLACATAFRNRSRQRQGSISSSRRTPGARTPPAGVSGRQPALRPLYQEAFPVTVWILTRLLKPLFGFRQPASYVLTRWLFLRLLGLVYLIAFVSLLTQISGLIGRRGIMPAEDFLDEVKSGTGRERYWHFPTLAWFNTGDAFLQSIAGAGAALSLLVCLGADWAPIMLVLWVLYLSLSTVSRDFLCFQWDALLLETGFLSIFWAPWRVPAPPAARLPAPPVQSPPSLAVLWLLRWLIFRLMFSSGAVKLLSGDQAWRGLTALNYHYETQPLPTPLAWYAAKLPERFQKFSVVMTFVIELGVPFLVFAPRPLRLTSAGILVWFQCLIAATGNYTFFNLLTIVLCVPLLDDNAARRLVPASITGRIMGSAQWRRGFRPGALVILPLSAAIAFLTSTNMLLMFSRRRSLPRSLRRLLSWQAPLHIANSYGLFAVMTTQRPEIIVEGSMDGRTWRAYEFKHKPGNLKRPPTWVAPHQPRLDWQMWFAALSDYRSNPWFVNFVVRLLQGSQPVLSLLAYNPFPDEPPTYIRALLYDYHFTDWQTRKQTGHWWRRSLIGIYFPAASLWGDRISRSR
ncbi:MAG TPA: lipase maturation factor family protein [Candidatus Obscuribacterales bacterium]